MTRTQFFFLKAPQGCGAKGDFDHTSTDLQHMCEAMMPISTKISEQCFKHFVERV